MDGGNKFGALLGLGIIAAGIALSSSAGPGTIIAGVAIGGLICLASMPKPIRVLAIIGALAAIVIIGTMAIGGS